MLSDQVVPELVGLRAIPNFGERYIPQVTVSRDGSQVPIQVRSQLAQDRDGSKPWNHHIEQSHRQEVSWRKGVLALWSVATSTEALELPTREPAGRVEVAGHELDALVVEEWPRITLKARMVVAHRLIVPWRCHLVRSGGALDSGHDATWGFASVRSAPIGPFWAHATSRTPAPWGMRH